MKPTNNPIPPDPLDSFFGPPQKDDPNQEPRDNMQFVADYAGNSEYFQKTEAIAAKCPCKTCKARLPFLRVAGFATAETLRAIYTGDTSKLDALVEFVEKLKKSA